MNPSLIAKRRVHYLLVLATLTFVSVLKAQSWEAIAPMVHARAEHKSVLLKDDRMLVAGGYGPDGKLVLECEIYNARTNTWSTGGTLNQGRRRHEMVVLKDGKVVAISGMVADDGSVTTSNEIFDPQTNKWVLLTPLQLGRSTFGSALLPDSTIMILGGLNVSAVLNQVELLDPKKNTVTSLPSMPERVWALNAYYSASQNGIVARGGGQGGSPGPYLRFTQFFSFDSHSWKMLQDAQSAQSTPDKGAVILDDERIVVPSGRSGETSLTKLVEAFDPFVGAWSALGQLIRDHDLTQILRVGRDSLLAIGGDVDPPIYNTIIGDCSWFNIVQGTSAIGPPLLTPRFRHQAEAVMLSDEVRCVGKQLLIVAGGMSSSHTILSSCERLDLGVKTRAALISPTPSIVQVPSECDVSIPIEFKVDVCESILLVGIEISGAGLTLVKPSLPITLSSGSHVIPIDVSGQPGHSAGAVKFIFKTPVGEQVSFIHVLAGDGNPIAGTLSTPSSISLTGSRCESSWADVTVSNLGCDSISIESIEPSGSLDYIVTRNATRALGPKEAETFRVLYVGELDQANGFVKIRYRRGTTEHDTVILLTVNLSGTPPLKTRTVMNDLQATNAGDEIVIPLYVLQRPPTTSQGFEIFLTFDKDLLELMDPSFDGTSAHAGLIDISETVDGAHLFFPGDVNVTEAEPLIKLRFKTFATLKSCTQLKMERLVFSPDDPKFTSCVLSANLDSARICVQDQCGSTELRGFLNGRVEDINSVRINNQDLIVNYEASGRVKFEVSNELGRLVCHQVSLSSPALIKLGSQIPSGGYFVRMVTPRSIQTKGFSITR